MMACGMPIVLRINFTPEHCLCWRRVRPESRAAGISWLQPMFITAEPSFSMNAPGNWNSLCRAVQHFPSCGNFSGIETWHVHLPC